MDYTEHHYFAAQFNDLRQRLTKLEGLITMNHAELLAGMQNVATQLAKANGEVQDKLAELHAAITAADNVPQPIVDALAALTASAQALDDIVPDAPTP